MCGKSFSISFALARRGITRSHLGPFRRRLPSDLPVQLVRDRLEEVQSIARCIQARTCQAFQFRNFSRYHAFGLGGLLDTEGKANG
jgi:hypothetical protein